ncbi:FGGY-family carbohydrate kinase [Thiomicrospira pelophila]|uniref:FGGY-family carbohydrate kinase n=1 Tax=Thiomicrospira pelophila TaxID=934 RepID=UPI0006891DFE|nr:FGGY-family carbohydrate kinase [Thiomicrospira pelophila]
MKNAIYDNLILGIDLGTSGIRAAIVRDQTQIHQFNVTLPFPERKDRQSEQNPSAWLNAFNDLLDQINQAGYTPYINQVIADATSSTVLLSNTQGRTLCNALMYDDSRAQIKAEIVQKHAPKNSAAQGANSSLSKALWLADHHPHTAQIQHQIDWVNFQLCGLLGVTDENNALKLGYDSIQQAWPDWVKDLCPFELPNVVPAGTLIGQVTEQLVKRWNFKQNCQVFAGTTDSIAAFLASGANQLGDAVTALGSTLAIKQLSDTPLFTAEYGIYSHKLKNKWLVGGASNAGGAVLLAHFSLDQLEQLIPQLNLQKPTGLACYPLNQPGERFPIADPNLQPIIPKTHTDIQLLQALIEGLVSVESLAYRKLKSLGAPKLNRLYAVGGGTHNQAWCQLRALRLPATIAKPISQSAAFGVTCLINPTTIQGNTL